MKEKKNSWHRLKYIFKTKYEEKNFRLIKVSQKSRGISTALRSLPSIVSEPLVAAWATLTLSLLLH